MERTKEFKERLATLYDEVKWLYGELYHGDGQAFEYFIGMLEKFYAERPAYLKELDRKRSADPEWYRGSGMLGMLMYVGAFAGNLKGVESHLGYIKESGVNYLHLMPLLKSPKGRSDGGYAVADFTQVEPELGTMDDLEHLAKECHGQGISLCLDFVMNHTSEDHEWAVKARQGDPECRKKYFFFDDWNLPNEFERTVPQVFPQTAPGNFSWCEEAGKVVMTTFYPYQWDLNYANPVVFNDMLGYMLSLANKGVDIVRLDAVPYIWKQLGTSCRNLPQVHTLVRIMRIACEVVCPGTLLLGEVVMEPEKVVPYFGSVEKPECHMLYNVTTMASTWHTVATRDTRLLKHQLDIVFGLPKAYTFLNYLRCHDDIGWGLDYGYLMNFGIGEVAHKKFLNDYLTGRWWGSNSRGELYNDDPRLGDARLCGTTASLCGIEAAEYEKNEFKEKMAIDLDCMLHAFLFTLSGIPVIYSGDEIGQLNDYSYHEDPLKWADSRYLHRGAFSWEEAELKDDAATRQGKIYQELRRLEAMRAGKELFCAEADVWTIETYNDKVLGIGRYYNGEKLLAFFNFGEDFQTAWIEEDEEYLNLENGERWRAYHIGVPAHGFVWLYKNYTEEKALAQAIAKAAEEGKKKTAAKKAAAKKAPAAKKAVKKPTEAKDEAAGAKADEAAAEKADAKPAAKRAARKTAPKKAAEAKAEEAGAKADANAEAKKGPAKKPAAKKASTKKADGKAEA